MDKEKITITGRYNIEDKEKCFAVKIDLFNEKEALKAFEMLLWAIKQDAGFVYKRGEDRWLIS